jgi:hypothetical protein
VALAALLTIALSYFMARYKTYVGRATNSPSLVADGYHSLMDMYSSIVVAAGLFGYAIGFRSLDKVAAVVVVLFIAYAGYEIARDALAGLSGHEHLGLHGLTGPGRLLRSGAPFLAALVALYLVTGVYTVQPGEVVQAFRDVASAREEKNKLINDAQGYANSVIPQARGEAQKQLRDAEGYKADVTNRARGEARRFADVVAQYRRDAETFGPEVTRYRLYVETMEQTLPKARKYIVEPGENGESVNLRILEPLPVAPPPSGWP